MGAVPFPAPVIPFVGRSDELRCITHLLTDPYCRLLTLIGPGGIGKTRLALEAARQYTNVHIISLQPLTSATFLVSAVIDALGVQVYPGNDPKQRLLDYLREKPWLLVLDNFEHLLDGATLLSEILANSSDIRLLVTSREPLNLVEEWILEVHGLPYPASEADGERYSAVELFIHHAQRISVGFTSRTVDHAAINRICRLVGGIPLAIELAASWVRTLSCAAIADEITRNLDILETDARNVEPRHRTMRVTLDQSWQLLSDAERVAFMKLSVFRGGFTPKAAQQVADTTLRLLSALVNKSLLQVGANGRYDFHDLLRHYAAEQLSASSEAEMMRDAHCAYYADFMGQWVEDPIPISQKEKLPQIIEELENIRVAFWRATDLVLLSEMEKFVRTLGYFYDVRDQYEEGAEVFLLASISLRKTLREPDEQKTRLLGLALAWRAWFLRFLLQLEEARQLAQESLALLQPLGDGREISHTYTFLTHISGNALERHHFAQAALKNARAIHFPLGIIFSLQNLSHTTRDLGNHPEAVRLLQEAFVLSRKYKLPYAEAYALIGLSEEASSEQNWIEAKRLAEEALIAASSIAFGAAMSLCHLTLGEIAHQSGNYQEEKYHYHECFMLAQKTANPLVAVALTGLGQAATRSGNYYEAGKHLSEALKLVWSSNTRMPSLALARNSTEADWLVDVIYGIAELKAATGESTRAVELLAHPLQNRKTKVQTRQRAEQLRSALETELSSQTYAAAWERGTKREISVVVEELLAELNPTAQTPLFAPLPSAHPLLTPPLSARELDVLRLVAAGCSNQEIADRLFIGVSTVKKHINHIYDKLDAKNRTQAVAHARARHLLS